MIGKSFAGALLLMMLVFGMGCESADTQMHLEPFAAVRPLSLDEVYLEVDPAIAAEKGALISVNDGDWTDSAVVRHGDKVDVAYTATPNQPTLRYEVIGPARTGYVRFTERRWFHDGFPEESRNVRVPGYDYRENQ